MTPRRQSFAGQQGKGGGRWQLLATGHAFVAGLLAFAFELVPQVGGDAVHVPGTDHLDAGLLQRVVDLARIARRGGTSSVHGRVVMTQPQGGGVGGTAQACDLGGRQGAARLRQADARFRHLGGAGLEGDLHVLVPADGAKRAGGGALEGLAACVIAGAAHRLLAEAPERRSSLKQR